MHVVFLAEHNPESTRSQQKDKVHPGMQRTLCNRRWFPSAFQPTACSGWSGRIAERQAASEARPLTRRALCSKWERLMPLLCWHRQCSIKDESTYRKPQMIGNGVVIGRITVDDVVCTACVQGLTHMRSPCAHETGGGSGLAGQHAPTVNTM